MRSDRALSLARRLLLSETPSLLHLAAIQLREIDRLDHQGRQTTVADEIGDDAAHEREHQPRTLDEQHRLKRFLRNLVEHEQAAISDLEQEESLLLLHGVDAQLEQHFERSGFRHTARLKIDGEVDLRLADVYTHARIFEGEVLDVLRDDLDHRQSRLAGRSRGSSAIGIFVELSHE